MEGGATSNSSAGKDEDAMREFLRMLEVHFKGRQCYLGQYARDKVISSVPEAKRNGDGSSGIPGVGSVLVTLEPPNKLVLGAFLTSGCDETWEYWEGEFGPSGLAAHRDSLGWDGHSLETLTDCVVGAIAEDRMSPPQPSSTAGEEASADEHQQRPPEFSVTEEAEGYLGEKSGTVLPSTHRPDTAAAVATPSGTLDLHYSGAGIVGSWEVRCLQSGISPSMVVSMHRSIRAACGRVSTNRVEASTSAGSGNDAPSSRRKPSASFKAKRKRVTGTGAALMGAGSSAEA
ncbi:unnamed protein product [Scytosiphon promiscuus]